MSDVDDYVLYSDKPEWNDVKPIPIVRDDEFFKIDYSSQFIDLIGYFRAISLANEMSKRALELTSDILYLNIANYTVWHYRRRLLVALQSDLHREREFVSWLMFPDNTKNYQSWYHRQWMVEQDENMIDLEMETTERTIIQESRNLHAWQYRLWLLKKAGKMNYSNKNELDFTKALIDSDCRNNSAWNHRFQLIFPSNEPFVEDRVGEEVDFARRYIQMMPNNESPWSYLTGIAITCGGFNKASYLVGMLRGIEDDGIKKCPYYLSTMADCAEDFAAVGVDYENNVNEAVNLLTQLVVVDPIRAEYWRSESKRVGRLSK